MPLKTEKKKTRSSKYRAEAADANTRGTYTDSLAGNDVVRRVDARQQGETEKKGKKGQKQGQLENKTAPNIRRGSVYKTTIRKERILKWTDLVGAMAAVENAKVSVRSCPSVERFEGSLVDAIVGVQRRQTARDRGTHAYRIARGYMIRVLSTPRGCFDGFAQPGRRSQLRRLLGLAFFLPSGESSHADRAKLQLGHKAALKGSGDNPSERNKMEVASSTPETAAS